VPEPPTIERAQLLELDQQFQQQINDDKALRVQFNPESLKVTLSNQLQQPASGGDQRGQSARQFVGAGTMKLGCQLWFDVTVPPYVGQYDDVRHVTEKVAYFITPKSPEDGGGGSDSQHTQLVPPAMRFVWGTFQFDGMMDSYEENLELFSPDGRPLRASVSIGLSQQKITPYAFAPPSGSSPGRNPLAQVPQGGTIPALAAAVGRAGNWQAIAAANKIEDPLRPAAGSLLDLSGR
jgi:Contractile injection system tube protein